MATNTQQVSDVISYNDYASIHNGVTISKSKAVFSQTCLLLRAGLEPLMQFQLRCG